LRLAFLSILILLTGLMIGCETAPPQSASPAPLIEPSFTEAPPQAAEPDVEVFSIPREPDLEEVASPELLALIETHLLMAVKRPARREIERQVTKELAELEALAEEPPLELPITINRQVENWVDYFQVRHRRHFATWLARSGRYIPLMRPILRSYGLPEDLVYLALIESGFNCQARSRAQAVGPWQFIKSTARRYDLKIDHFVDERRDPVKSTHAAARYLKDLHDEFDSWYLAAAAYNGGERRVRTALKQLKADNFWDIAKPSKRRYYLKRETRNYVPKMIAAAIIAKDPEGYGFGDVVYEEPLAFETVSLDRSIDLRLLAKEVGATYAALKELNPELRHPATPPGQDHYRLRLPPGSPTDFLAHLDRLEAEPIKAYLTYRLKKGENPYIIAQRYKVPVETILIINNIKDPRRLRPGHLLKVPVAAVAQKRTQADQTEKKARRQTPEPGTHPSDQQVVVYVVRQGDTVSQIGQRFGVDYRLILSHNRIRDHRRIKPGQRLEIPLGQETVQTAARTRPAPQKAGTTASSPKASSQIIIHVVREGESIWKIGRGYGVSHQLILSRNNIPLRHTLKIGQKLEIPVGPEKAADQTLPQESSWGESIIHVVKSGETVWGISRKYNIPYQAILAWNNITNDRRLKPGQRLSLYLGKGGSG